MSTKAMLEFMIRVKLPSAASFHASPSGDTEYEDAFRKAIVENMPEDFEVIWPLMNRKTPTDSEGFTWVRLRYNGKCAANPQAHWIQECQAVQKELRELKAAIRRLPMGSG